VVVRSNIKCALERTCSADPGQYSTIHRAEYHETLYDEFVRLGGEIRLGCDVQKFSFDEPSVTTADGEEIQGDVVVGADGRTPSTPYISCLSNVETGLWSTARDQLLGIPTPPTPTGDLAYRMTLDDETLSSVDDPAVIDLLRPNAASVWLGPDRHCVFYPIRARKEWNLVLM
jgi:salicylate hydroxylase